MLMEEKIDSTKYWTLLLRNEGGKGDEYNFKVRVINLLDSNTLLAQSLEDYTISFTGYTGNNCDLYVERRGNKREIVDPSNDLGFGDGVPRVRVSDLVGKKNISAGSDEHFTITAEGTIRTSVNLRVEDTKPFDIRRGIRTNNLDIEVGKLDNAQTSKIE